VASNLQDKGIGKTILANQLKLWDHLGVEELSLNANIDVGGYAWARYGYVPSISDWEDIQDRTKRTMKNVIMSAGTREKLDKILDHSADPWQISELAGLKEKVEDPSFGGQKEIGKIALLHSSWDGTLDLTSKGAYSDFRRYMGR
jgi:hypothetical protein